jgi:hypothetical protein
VDKRLISNLIVAYFTTNKKNEVLTLMLRILDVPKAQREAIYAGATRGWFGSSKIVEEEQDDEKSQKSLGDLWIEYLMKEASPDDNTANNK